MAFLSLDKIENIELLPGFNVRFVHSETMTFAHWKIQSGSVLPEHQHHHEQVATIFDGRFELTIDGVTRIMDVGMVAIIPSNALHSGKALTDC